MKSYVQKAIQRINKINKNKKEIIDNINSINKYLKIILKKIINDEIDENCSYALDIIEDDIKNLRNYL